MTDNLAYRGNDMCHAGYSDEDSIDNGNTYAVGVSNNRDANITGVISVEGVSSSEESAIDVIPDSRKRFSNCNQIKGSIVHYFQHIV